MDEPVGVNADQIDMCIWNYQTGAPCKPDFDCQRVQVHHKPTSPPKGNDCGKLKYGKGPQSAAFPPSTPRRPRRPGSCSTKCVHMGSNCKCGASPVKTVPVNGTVKSCERMVNNPSGDTFKVSFSASHVTVERQQGCWCDDSVFAQCCIDE